MAAAARTPTDPERRAAATALRTLRSGLPDAGADLATFGPYRDGIAALRTALSDGGQVGVERAYQRLCSADPAWIALLAADAPPIDPESRMPQLPDAAKAIEALKEPAGTWIDAYLAYAQAAAPMSPASFHEASALFLLSLAVARRCYVQSGTMKIWPIVWFLGVAVPGKYKKTAAQYVAATVMDAAGLHDLRLHIDSLTPEALINVMNPTYLKPSLRPDEREAYCEKRKFANVRGWLNDETQQLFISTQRDYNAELMSMLLKLFNGDSYTKATGARGEESIGDPYLSILGASTPGSMRPFLSKPDLWESGMWSRFILLKPDTRSEWQLESPDAAPPVSLTSRLNQLFTMFEMPSLTVETEIDKGKEKSAFLTHEAARAVAVTIEPAAFAAWGEYRKALEYSLIDDEGALVSVIPEMLTASYIRFPGIAIRVAILLAAADAADAGLDARTITIEARHYARAQRMTERWRAILHSFYEANVRTDESALQQRVLRYLKQSKTALTQHALCELTHVKAKEMKECLEVLESAGKVVSVATPAKNGRTVTLWSNTDRELDRSAAPVVHV